MTIVNGELHHRSVTGAFQHCVSPEEGCEILWEIYEGDCGHHVSSKSLVAKAFRHGFYWLTAHADADDIPVNVMVVKTFLDGLMYRLKS